LLAFIKKSVSEGRYIYVMSCITKIAATNVFVSDYSKYRIEGMNNASKVNVGDNANITMN